MNTKQRGNLLRERLGKLFPVAVTPWPKAQRKKVQRERPGVMRTAFYGVSFLEENRRKKWIAEPDPKPRTVPRAKRNAGVPVLTRIAAKAAPKKLKRLHANAEYLLAEHARR